MKFDEQHAPRLCSAYTRNAAKCHEEKSSSSEVTRAEAIFNAHGLIVQWIEYGFPKP